MGLGMKALSLGFVAVVLLVPACSGFLQTQSPSSSASSTPAARKAPAHRSARIRAEDPALAAAAARRPRVGDYYVERFSGSFRATPLTLTEEVVASEDGLFVIDYTLEETANPRIQHLRTRFNPETRRVERVSVMDGDREIPAPLAAYDRLIEKTSFAADSNNGLIGSEKQTCLVGGRELACETRDYKVSVGEREATLSVTTSDAVTGRDVAGQIVADGDKVLYRAELVDMRRGSGSSSAAALNEFNPTQP